MSERGGRASLPRFRLAYVSETRLMFDCTVRMMNQISRAAITISAMPMIISTGLLLRPGAPVGPASTDSHHAPRHGLAAR